MAVGFRRVALAMVAAVALALGLGLPVAHGPLARADGQDRPPQSVAHSRVAVVRVLTYYYGTTNTTAAPIPVLAPCASVGVLVGTTGQNLNSANYVLTPTAAVNPLVPCQGVQAAFQQLNGTAASWGITRIQVVLNAAYTGVSSSQRGSITYTISPGLLTTNGGPGAPRLLALPLANGANSPKHDLPVLSIPQPSDAPATGVAQVIDLTGINGQPLNRDAVQQSEVNDTLYPITVPVDQIPQPTSKSGKSSPTAGSAPSASPSALSNSIGIGGAAVDSNGRLVGMVVKDSNGNHVLAPLSELKSAIGSVTSQPGPLMTAWQKGIAAFYASPSDYSAATSAFRGVLTSAPDFAGAQPFLDAAQQQTTTIPSLTHAPASTPSTGISGLAPSLGLSKRTLLIIGGGMAAGALVLALLLVLFLRRRRALSAVAWATPPDEIGLDLLPRDSMYEIPAIDTLQSMPAVRPAPPRSQPRSHPRSQPLPDVEDMPTGALPAMPPAMPQAMPAIPPASKATGAPVGRPTAPPPPAFSEWPAPSQSRKNTSLMSYAAGLTHPGVKRASEPNQDNMLALHGVRVAGSRPQPYGLYIVADGMGGHLNGQEASRLAIEIVTRTVMQVLNSSQPLDGPALAEVLRDGVQRANDELRQRNVNERADMGTTMTAAIIVDDQAAVVNIGDSRTYLMSPEAGLRQITTDHSVVASLVSAGVIRPEDVYTHPRRNQIYRSLGGDEEQIEVDLFPVALQAGDKLLLCSDGLWEMVRDPQIENILRATADPQQAAQLLVREANTNGGEDNISALVVRLVDDLPQNAQPGMRVIVAPSSPAPEASQSHS
jgi:serine/threonine protein phosphatase PrpC